MRAAAASKVGAFALVCFLVIVFSLSPTFKGDFFELPSHLAKPTPVASISKTAVASPSRGGPVPLMNAGSRPTAGGLANPSIPPAVTAKMTVFPTVGYVGATLEFNGTGYAKKSTVIVSWSGGTACTASTNSTGAFSCSFSLPDASVGGQTFTGTDASDNSATATFTVVPHLTVSPTSGPAGTPVTFVGTGFVSTGCCATEYYVSWMNGSIQACSAGNSGTGTFSCTYTIPIGTPTATYTFTGTDPSSDTATASFKVTYTPVLEVSPIVGQVGTLLTFNGSSFAKSATVIVSWSGGTACSGTTNTAGAFTCNYTLPAAGAGGQTFTATDPKSGAATATFTVVPQLVDNPTSGPAGTTVTFVGTGFVSTGCCATEYYVTWMSGSVTACSAGNSGTGSFSCTYTIPTGSPAGTYKFTGTDPSSNTATTTFKVTYTPVLSVSPMLGHVGSLLTFKGSGYAKSSTVVVTWNSQTACSSTSNATGGFTCSYTLPAAPIGTQTFTGTDTNSGTASTTFTVVPQLTVSPTFGAAGTMVTFVGTGYVSTGCCATDYYVTWISGSVTACTAGNSGTGSFSCTYTIPSGVTAGAYPFTGTDAAGNSEIVTFTIDPVLTVGPSTGQVGTQVTFNGSSFAVNSSVSVTWSGGTACTATTGNGGSFNCTFEIPAWTIGGSYKFTATDSATHKATAVFKDTPKLSVSALSATVGKTITFKGTGYAANSSVTVSWVSGTACTATTSSAGAFSCTFKVPATAGGSYSFNASDANFNTGLVSFKVTPALTATPASGAVGSSTIFSGTGFSAKSAVWVNWSAGTACTGTTGSAGSFACSFAIPEAAGGAYTFTGTDSHSLKGAATFTVDPKLTDSPTSGAPGTVVTFNGTGFAADSAVTVNWSGGTVCIVITSGVGNFSCQYTIPTGTATGTYTFTATDAQGTSATVTFKVT